MTEKKIGSALTDSVATVKELFHSTADSVGRSVKHAQITSSLAEAYRALGTAVYTQHAQQPFLPVTFSAELARINELLRELAAVEVAPSTAPAPTSKPCPHCHQTLALDAKFCPSCGQKQ